MTIANRILPLDGVPQITDEQREFIRRKQGVDPSEEDQALIAQTIEAATAEIQRRRLQQLADSKVGGVSAGYRGHEYNCTRRQGRTNTVRQG